MIKSVVFMPQDWAIDFSQADPTAMISIVDPGVTNPTFHQLHVNVLNLQFKDFVKPDPRFGTFTDSHAEAIASFVHNLSLREEQIDLVVHCRKGQSRSAAVAKWVGDHLKISVRSVPGNIGTRMANVLVYETLNRLDMSKVSLFQMPLPVQATVKKVSVKQEKSLAEWLAKKISTLASDFLKR